MPRYGIFCGSRGSQLLSNTQPHLRGGLIKRSEVQVTCDLLSVEIVSDFARNGFAFIPGLFDRTEIELISGWTDELAALPETPGKQMMYFESSLCDSSHRILSRIENFYPYHRRFREIIDGEKMRGCVPQLLGECAILFKDKINFKLPGGGGFDTHQDMQAGWNAYANLHITAMVAIDPCSEENGCLEIAAGHHTRGLIGKMWEPLAGPEVETLDFVPYPAAPGDAIFFDSYTPHRSAPNHTDRSRRVLYVTWNGLSQGDHRVQYYADKRRNYPPDCERDPGKHYQYRV